MAIKPSEVGSALPNIGKHTQEMISHVEGLIDKHLRNTPKPEKEGQPFEAEIVLDGGQWVKQPFDKDRLRSSLQRLYQGAGWMVSGVVVREATQRTLDSLHQITIMIAMQPKPGKKR